jgi:hypothetical protein
MPNEFQLSNVQRGKLFNFVKEFDALYSDGSFQRDESSDDVSLVLYGNQ